MSYGIFHSQNPPPESSTLSPVQYGHQGIEFTGTLVDPSGIPQPAVLALGYLGYHKYYEPIKDNVEGNVVFGNPPQVGTLSPNNGETKEKTMATCPDNSVDFDPCADTTLKTLPSGLISDDATRIYNLNIAKLQCIIQTLIDNGSI